MSKHHLDEIDHQILLLLIKNCRTPFTDIAKKLLISAGTVHIRVKKMEESGTIKGSTLIVDYERMGYMLIAYVGLVLENTSHSNQIIDEIHKIPEVTVAHITTGEFSIFCKLRATNTKHAKEIIFKLDNIPGVVRTETSISLDEVINDKKRLMNHIFNNLK
jgi:Lrp/AsnC family transcriptional regulator for asnA, asnC and gidA